MAELRLDGIAKRFGRTDVLRDLDLAVADGELVVLVGPSGSGKTTALRIAAGLDAADAGTVRIGGRDVTRAAPGRRQVAMVFQGLALFPHLTAAENIGFGLRARGVTGRDLDRRVREAADLVACGRLLDRRPAALSGGERQRVALARALVGEPDVFLLDEPLAGLDPPLRTQLRVEIRGLHDRVGATMLHVTHDQHEALTLADRVAVLHDGTVQQAGAPDEVYGRPANRFVARFVGSPAMNLLPVTGTTLGPFDGGHDGQAVLDGAAEAGIRPEDVRLVAPAPGSGAWSTGPGRVRVVEVAGSDAYVHVEFGEHVVVTRVAADARPAVGETATLALRRERLHRFGPDGRRLPDRSP